MTRAEIAAAARHRDVELLSAYLDCEGSKGAALALGVSHDNFRGRLRRLHHRVGVSTTAGLVYALRHDLEAYREGEPRR